jgi:hypothetical protein
VPSFQLREEEPEELLGRRLVLGVSVHVQYRRRVDGRLHDPGGLAFGRGVGATLGVPEIYSGEVLAEAGVENYLGEEAVVPLAIEEVRDLRGSTVLGVVGVAHGDERRVPRPLVGIEAGPRLRVLPVPVEVQNHLGLLDEPLIEFVHEVSLLKVFCSPITVPGQRAHST